MDGMCLREEVREGGKEGRVSENYDTFSLPLKSITRLPLTP